MSNNLSSLNPGISLFDGLDLQNQQEKEIQKEEEHQQNELRALLTHAFDDLMDEDDEFSVTSDEGGDSRNQSLHFKSKDETEPIAEEDEEPSGLIFTHRRPFPLPTSTPLGGLPTIAQSPYGSMTSLRQSQESVRNSQELLRSSNEGALRRSQEGILESDGYHSNSEQSSTNSSNRHHLHHHQFHQVPDWTSRDAFTHHGHQNIYDPSHHGNLYHQHHPHNTNQETESVQTHRFGEIPERQETEGGNSEQAEPAHYLGHYQYHHLHHHMGYYRDSHDSDQPRADNFVPYSDTPHSQDYQNTMQSDQGYYTNTTSLPSGHPVHGHDLNTDNIPAHPLSPEKDYHGNYKVSYSKREEAEDSDDESSQPTADKRPKTEEILDNPDPIESRQMAQLQALYKARGRKLEEVTNDLETYKQETEREIRILKHQVSLAKGEREGTSTNLKQCQDLLMDCKTENAQLKGKLQATESQVEALQRGKDEAIKSLQTAEANIETMNQQLAEMGSSDSLDRARHEHERVVAGIQQKHEKEVKVLKEKIEALTDKLNDVNSENSILRQKLNESYKEAESAQISRAETINRLTKSLEESQKQCRTLLESASSHESSQLKIQLQQCKASKKIADEMILSYQDEVKDLKEQLNMFEAASNLGVLSQETTRDSEGGHDDSMFDLGIKKTIDFDETPEPVRHSHSARSGAESHDLVANLKIELERCLLSNKEKRIQVTKLQEDLRSTKKSLEEYHQRSVRAEKSLEECKSKLKEWEELIRLDDKASAVEVRLTKDVNNLKREKQVLLEDAEDLKKRLEEVAESEAKLSEINQQLNQQMSQMVKDYDQDKREALERCQRACESVHETAREQLRLKLIEEFSSEKSDLITKYEMDLTKLRNDYNAALGELDRVKELYVKVCSEKDNVEIKTREAAEEQMLQKIQQVKDELQREKEENVSKVKEEMKCEEEKLRNQIHNELQQKLAEENEKVIETKIAMCKMEWFEEQKSSKQAAVDNAIKLTEAEWKSKLETTLETELESKIQEAKTEWQKEKEKSFETKLNVYLEQEKEKWQKTANNELQQKLQLEKEACKKESENELWQKIHLEKESWEKLSETNLEQKLSLAKEEWEQQSKSDLQQKLDRERELWIQESEKEYQKKLFVEKENWRTLSANEFQEKLDTEKEALEKKFEDQLRSRLTKEKDAWLKEKEEDLKKAVENERSKVMSKTESNTQSFLEKEKEKWQKKVEQELQSTLEKAKKDWEEKSEIDVLKRLQNEKLKWNELKEKEIEEKLELERKQWEQSLETQTQEKIETEVESRVMHEKERWKILMESQKSEEIQSAIEQARREWDDCHDENLQQIKDSMEESIQERISAEVSIAIDEAKKLWQKEHEADIQANNSSFEISQSVLREEIDSLKKELERVNNEIKQKDEKFRQEKVELTRQKDCERKKAVEEIQDQCEKDYKQFTADHHDTLTLALKTARDQHTKEKLELEKRHAEEIRKYQYKESQLKKARDQANIERSSHSSNEEKHNKERELWEKENYRLKQEVMERDQLLEKADRHLAQEVERLKSELEVAYKKRLESETATLKEDFEKELSKGKQSTRGEMSELESKLMELKHEKERFRGELGKVTDENKKVIDEIHKVTEESYKVKGQVHKLSEENKKLKEEIKTVKERMFEETKKYVKEIQELKGKVGNQDKKLSEQQNQEVEVLQLKAECEKLKSENSVISSMKVECEKLKTQWEELMAEKTDMQKEYSKSLSDLEQTEKDKLEMIENYQLLKAELEKVVSEKTLFSENVKNLEMAYKKDLAAQKQKQDESNSRLARSEKMLQDLKHHYKTEIEKVKKSLERDNNIAMESMKNKMREMAKAHNTAMTAITKQYKEELDELKDRSHDKCLSDTEVQTDSEDQSDDSMFELRDQYLDTVNKIKDDVMKHITDTNMRAAETVRREMDKERTTTLVQLKKIYMENVRKVLHNEILGANIEAKLADIEEALDAISFEKSSRSSSRSTTPRSDMSAPLSGQGHSETNSGFTPKTKHFSDYKYPNEYPSKVNGYPVSRSYQDISLSPISRSNDFMPTSRSQDYSNFSSNEKSKPRSAGDGAPRKEDISNHNLQQREATLQQDRMRNRRNNELHLEISTNGVTAAKNSYNYTSSQKESSPRDQQIDYRHRARVQSRDKSRSGRGSRERSSSKEVTFSKDCKKSSPDRQEEKSNDRYARLHPNITSRKLSPRDHSTSNENSDQEYNSPRTFKLGQFNGVDLLPSRYVMPINKEQSANKFEAVDPHPIERKAKVLHEELSSPVVNHQSSLYKAKSESELSMDQHYGSFLGSYKYMPLRDHLSKAGESVQTPKGSSISQEDLRFSGTPVLGFDGKKAYSVDVGLQSLGLEQNSPRKYNPSPEKLPQRDAGESPMGTPRMHRKFRSDDHQIDADRVRRNIGHSIDGWAEYSIRTKEPVKTLVQKFEPKSQ